MGNGISFLLFMVEVFKLCLVGCMSKLCLR